ncbi:MAG: thioesterase family protein [Zoogloea sp.]|uniref:acyl-CoA thioesterase n=1 Tax=Zoogloea sp. TaxID=49181 RepID=UPI002626134F|nr:thioesterase family protein [Zoogloea sp.]MDD3325992.1 thioesterase family protein [Zoogloea sp.]
MTDPSSVQTAGRRLLITSRMPVRWGDMDAYGHVNNTVYFRYLEQTRVEWLEQMGSAVSPDNAEAPVIINAACTFMLPVNYPATVIVRMYGGEPGRSSLMTWYELLVEGDERIYAEGSSKVVWMNPQTGKSVPLPEAVRAAVS